MIVIVFGVGRGERKWVKFFSPPYWDDEPRGRINEENEKKSRQHRERKRKRKGEGERSGLWWRLLSFWDSTVKVVLFPSIYALEFNHLLLSLS